MLGGDPIRGEASLYIDQDSYDPENEFCIMIQDMKLNHEDTKFLVLEFIKRSGIDVTSFEEEMNKAVFDITDHNVFEYYYYPGIPVYIETARETNLKVRTTDMRQVEITTIELLPSDN
jgi:predicted nucleic acid-binding protein